MKLLFLLLLTGLYLTGYSQVKLSGTYTLQCWEYGEQYTFDSDSTFTYASEGCSPSGTIGKGRYTIVNNVLTLHFQQIHDSSFSFTYSGSIDSQSKEQCVVVHINPNSNLRNYSLYYFLADKNSFRLSNTASTGTGICFTPDTSPVYISRICIGSLSYERNLPIYKNRYNHHVYNVTILADPAPDLREEGTRVFVIKDNSADMFYGKYAGSENAVLFLKNDIAQEAKSEKRLKVEGCTKEVHRIINR